VTDGAAGWAFDPDSSNTSINIQIWVDGVLDTIWPANLPSPDVNLAYGITGNHRYVRQTPSIYRNGVAHIWRIYSVNTPPGPNPEQNLSPRTYTYPKPNLTSVTVTQPDYCVAGPAATLNWTYNDAPLGSTAQTKFQIQVDDQPSFNSPSIDVTINGAATSYTTPGTLAWNTTYSARVRAWDGDNNVSDWVVATCVGSCVNVTQWKTPNHSYPSNVNFTVAPPKPIINQPVQFTSTAICYDNSNNPTPCATHTWTWGDGTPGLSGNYPAPTHTYNAEGTYTVTYQVTDQTGYVCPVIPLSKNVKVQKPIPFWKEVLPK